MRKALPWILLVVALLIGLAVWKTEGFGLLGDPAARDGVSAEDAPDATTGTEGGLKGRGIDPEKDPKTFEGDPVGSVDAKRGGAAVKGRVVDATSRAPIRFARVSPVPATPDEPRVAVRTTKEGLFEIRGLPAGPLDLRFAADEHHGRTTTTPALEEAKPAADLGDVPLKPRGPMKDGIEVTVTDEAGRPVVGAKVSATTLPYGVYVTLGAEMAGVSGTFSKDVATDELGRARFFPLPVQKYDVVVRADGYAMEPVANVVVVAGRVEHVRVVLKVGLTISGRVVDRAGAGVAKAYVSGLHFPSFQNAPAVVADESGAFTLNGLVPSMYWLFAGHEEKGEGNAVNVKTGSQGVRIELKGAGYVSGRVVHADGTPATKFTLRPWVAGEFRYIYSASHAIEHAEGKFRLPMGPGTYNLDAIAEGGVLVTVPSVKVELDQTKEIEIKLPAEAVVRGVVTDPQGDHLGDAEVYIERGIPPAPVREQHVRTDADGVFLLKGLPQESLKVHIRHAAYPIKVVDVMPAPLASAKEITVRLVAGAKVVGHVTSKDGAPAKNLRVNLFTMERFDLLNAKTAYTDDSGAFTFTGVRPNQYTVQAGRFENNAAGPSKKVQVPEEGTVTVDLQVEGDTGATGVLTGRVLVGGAPAADATVEAFDERGSGNTVTGKTDAQGRYTLKGFQAGRITAKVTTASGAEDWKTGRIGAPGQTATLDFSLGAGSLKGVLVSAEGVTVSGGWITIERAEAGRATGWENVRAWLQSGNDGSFTSTGLEKGTYRVRVTGTGFAVRVTDAFEVGDGEAKDLGSIRLQPGATISGRVTDDTGKPVEAAGVSVKNSKGEAVLLFSMVVTGSDGRYTVPGLEPGAYVLLFDAKGHAPAERATTVGAQAGGATVDAVLQSGGTLAALVEDDRGVPVKDARVELYDSTGARVTRTLTIVNFMEGDVARTSATGTATIRDLVPGTYTIKAGKDGMVLVGDGVIVNVASHQTSNAKVVLRTGP